MRIKFFVGKGGVGKTSVAASYGVFLSSQGYKTLLVSLDPAHNLGDILERRLSDSVARIEGNLFAREVDIEKEISRYLDRIAQTLKVTYRYLSVLNMEGYFKILKYSPGMEEQATLEAIKKHVFSEDYDYVLFDTAPTGHTLRVLSLPSVSLLWVEELLKLRRVILDRRRMIERVKGRLGEGVATSEEDDDIAKELKRIKEEYAALEKKLRNRETGYIAILNAEEVPLLETERLVSFLESFGMRVERIVVNKYMPDRVPKQADVMKEIERKFLNYEIKVIPYMDRSPRGVESLREVYTSCLK